jgi:hypothetical protein
MRDPSYNVCYFMSTRNSFFFLVINEIVDSMMCHINLIVYLLMVFITNCNGKQSNDCDYEVRSFLL